MNIKEFAQHVANLIGIELSWEIPDRAVWPAVQDFKISEGLETGLDSLSFVANIVGGVLRWDGENKYTIYEVQ